LRGELRGHRDVSTTTANTSGFRFDIDYVVSSDGTRRANWWLSRLQDNFRMRLVQFSLNGIDCIGLQSTSDVTGAPLRLSNLRFTGTKSDDEMFLQRLFLSDLDVKTLSSGVDYSVISDGQPLVRLYSDIVTSAKDHKWQFNDADVLTGNNTVVDSNGFVKAASPILRLFANHLEEHMQPQGAVLEKLSTGYYRITGTLGFAKSGWWIETPKDVNGMPKFHTEFNQEEDNAIVIRTFSLEDKTTPVDITESRWIDIRLDKPVVEDPEDAI